MNLTELKGFKSFLLDQKKQVLNKASEFNPEADLYNEGHADEAELASQDLSMAMAIHLHERDRSLLFKIEKALSKIEDGSFGRCDACSEPIGQKRLKARPFATLCIDCKEDQESRSVSAHF